MAFAENVESFTTETYPIIFNIDLKEPVVTSMSFRVPTKLYNKPFPEFLEMSKTDHEELLATFLMAIHDKNVEALIEVTDLDEEFTAEALCNAPSIVDSQIEELCC